MVNQAQRSEATTRAILAAAREAFATQGYDATSVDEIAAACGIAKGAVYHHFASKKTLFARVLEQVQAELAAVPPDDLSPDMQPLDVIVAAVKQYLTATSEPRVRRIVLIDGPAVVGWEHWRELDYRYFGAGARLGVQTLCGARASAARIDAVTHLLMGAVTEAALVCATSTNPARFVRGLTDALRDLLAGVGATPPRARRSRRNAD